MTAFGNIWFHKAWSFEPLSFLRYACIYVIKLWSYLTGVTTTNHNRQISTWCWTGNPRFHNFEKEKIYLRKKWTVTSIIDAIHFRFMESCITKAEWGCCRLMNTLCLNDAIRRHMDGSALVQAMACCLTPQSHRSNQCWPITNRILWHPADISIATNVQDIIETNSRSRF